jgi:hypothetical protein
MDADVVQSEITEDSLMVLTPYKNSISIMLKQGIHLAYALHDGTDEGGDMETLKMLCLYRFNKGESNEETT